MTYRVSQMILQQLGGRKFLSMTGAHSLTYGDNCLIFKLPTNPKKVTGVKIILTPMDDYTMEFINVGSVKQNFAVTKKVINNVYFDMMQDIFTENTGLYTTLG